MPYSRGIAPVIGAVFLVAIAILLAAVFFIFAAGFETGQVAPQAAAETTFYSEVDLATGDATPYIRFQHEGGDTIEREDLRAVVTVGGQSFDDLPLEGATTGRVSAGDTMSYDLSNANLCSRPADEFTVRLVHEPSNKLVGKQDVDINGDIDISVTGNSVTSDVPYTATVTVVGMAASSNSGTDLEPDTLGARVVIDRPSGTEKLTPWPDGNPDNAYRGPFDDNINRPVRSPGISYTTERLSPDSSVTLEMRSDKPKNWDYPGTDSVTRGGTTYEVGHPDSSPTDPLADNRFWVDSGNPSEGNIVLRKDGEAVPTYGLAASHQRTLQEILGSQLDANGKLNLDDNDVVALYELTDPTAKPSNAPPPTGSGNPDYNDGVAIIEINPVSGASTSDPGTLYC